MPIGATVNRDKRDAPATPGFSSSDHVSLAKWACVNTAHVSSCKVRELRVPRPHTYGAERGQPCLRYLYIRIYAYMHMHTCICLSPLDGINHVCCCLLGPRPAC